MFYFHSWKVILMIRKKISLSFEHKETNFNNFKLSNRSMTAANFLLVYNYFATIWRNCLWLKKFQDYNLQNSYKLNYLYPEKKFSKHIHVCGGKIVKYLTAILPWNLQVTLKDIYTYIQIYFIQHLGNIKFLRFRVIWVYLFIH